METSSSKKLPRILALEKVTGELENSYEEELHEKSDSQTGEYEKEQGESSLEKRLLPGVYPMLKEKLIDLPYHRAQTNSGAEYDKQTMEAMTTASAFIGRLFFSDKLKGEDSQKEVIKRNSYDSHKVDKDSEMMDVEITRTCATCILIAPNLVITSKKANPILSEDDEVFAVFSPYGCPETSTRYKLTLDPIGLSDDDFLLFRVEPNQKPFLLNFEDLPKIFQGGISEQDELFLVGFPAFIDEEISSCVVAQTKEEELKYLFNMKNYCSKTLVWYNDPFVEQKQDSLIVQRFKHQINLMKINHEGLKEMTGTSGFGVFRLEPFDEKKKDRNVEWCGVVMAQDIVKTVQHLAGRLIDTFFYSLSGYGSNTTHMGRIRLPVGTYSVSIVTSTERSSDRSYVTHDRNSQAEGDTNIKFSSHNQAMVWTQGTSGKRRRNHLGDLNIVEPTTVIFDVSGLMNNQIIEFRRSNPPPKYNYVLEKSVQEIDRNLLTTSLQSLYSQYIQDNPIEQALLSKNFSMVKNILETKLLNAKIDEYTVVFITWMLFALEMVQNSEINLSNLLDTLRGGQTSEELSNSIEDPTYMLLEENTSRYMMPYNLSSQTQLQYSLIQSVRLFNDSVLEQAKKEEEVLRRIIPPSGDVELQFDNKMEYIQSMLMRNARELSRPKISEKKSPNSNLLQKAINHVLGSIDARKLVHNTHTLTALDNYLRSNILRVRG